MEFEDSMIIIWILGVILQSLLVIFWNSKVTWFFLGYFIGFTICLVLLYRPLSKINKKFLKHIEDCLNIIKDYEKFIEVKRRKRIKR